MITARMAGWECGLPMLQVYRGLGSGSITNAVATLTVYNAATRALIGTLNGRRKVVVNLPGAVPSNTIRSSLGGMTTGERCAGVIA